MKTSLRYIILITVLGLSLIACKKSANDSEVELDKNLIKSPKKYAQLVEERTDSPGSFRIVDIKRNLDILTISVKGGCKEEDFKIVWDGQILLSYPAQVRLVLYNNASGACPTDNEFNITVNLSKIIGKDDPKGFVFHVANGSVKQDTSIDPNGSVSSK